MPTRRAMTFPVTDDIGGLSATLARIREIQVTYRIDETRPS